MKYLQYTFIAIALLLVSCSDFLDINEDPTRITDDDISVEILLPTVCESTASAQYNAGLTANLVTHHLDNVQAGYYQTFRLSGLWSTAYLTSLNNLQKIKNLAEKAGSPHYVGVASILQAVNLGLLTDCFENVPFSDALGESLNTSPAYDKQEDVYREIIKLLDEGIALVNAAESLQSPGNDDLFFQGDLEQWERTAHSLKARYMLHVLDKNMGFSAGDILNEVEQGFSSIEENFELIYFSNYVNPWYAGIAALLDQNIATQSYGKFFIDLMNGEEYDVIDPRLPYLAENSWGEDEGYVGLASYISDTLYNAIPTKNTFYMRPTAPLIIMSYSELKFIEAEVAMDSDVTRATEAYNEGIRSHMENIGMEDENEISDYLNDPAVSSFDLEHLLKEKYIATVFNPEAWNDMRRYGFDTDLYKGFYEPNLNGRSVPAYRALYPISEQSRNGANWNANRKEFTEKMWKDQ